MTIRKNVPLAPLTTFDIGGNAQYLAEASNEDDIREALAWSREKNTALYVIAGGSNILVPDEGLEGLVLRLVPGEWGITGSTLEAYAGCNLLELIQAAAGENLTGWERMAGVPGSIGGAARGNAGAFGTEMKDIVTWVRAMNITTEEMHEFSNSECAFAYRLSYFKKHPEWIITHVHVTLQQGNQAEVSQKIDETIAERERRHIQDVKAAGSFFVNPVAPPEICRLFEEEKGATAREGRVPAGWLIEKVGMKGTRVGGAEASAQHPNYLKNAEHATADEVRELAERIKIAVREAFGIELQEEAAILF